MGYWTRNLTKNCTKKQELTMVNNEPYNQTYKDNRDYTIEFLIDINRAMYSKLTELLPEGDEFLVKIKVLMDHMLS